MPAPLAPRRPTEVFALEPDRAQLIVRSRSGPPGRVEVGDRVLELERPTQAVDLVDLAPGRHRALVVPRRGPAHHVEIETAASATGPELFRFATLSDLHLGSTGFGLVFELDERSPPGGVEHPMRCARAALDEAVAWGAELIVLKGDLTHKGRLSEWALLAGLLDRVPVPVVLTIGNHDQGRGRDGVDPEVGLASIGRTVPPVQVLDRPGVRIIVVDSTVPGHGYGRLAHLSEDLLRAVDVPRPCVVLSHHQPMTAVVPRYWPLGVPAPSSRRLLDELHRVNPDLLWSAGHTHRNRRHDLAGVTVTEVGAPKDHPGVWAGYRVHPGAIVQTVRRIARPDCLAWTEHTAGAVAGVWGHWSPGRLEDRSFTLPCGRGELDPAGAQVAISTS